MVYYFMTVTALKTYAGRKYVGLAIALVLCALSYSNTFSAPFVFDDRSYISQNPLVEYPAMLLSPSDIPFTILPENLSTHLYTRAVAFLSFSLNYAVGELDVRGYHLVNLIIHLVNAALVYALALLTLRTPFLEKTALAENAGYAAFLSSALFAVHPIQTEAVTYISQRFTSLATLFYLFAVALYAKYRMDGKKAFYAGALCSGGLAMLTKEISFTLPLSVVLYEIVFFEGGLAEKIRRMFLFSLLWLIPIGLLAFGLSSPGKGVSDFPTPQYQITAFAFLAEYLKLFILPFGQNLDYDIEFEPWFIVKTALSFILMAGLLIGSIRYYRRKKDSSPESRIIAFGIFWFFLTLSIETLVPLGDVIFEHRAYLPSAFLFISFSAFAVGYYEKIAGQRFKTAFHAALFFIIASLMLLTLARNHVWSDPVRLWTDTAAKSPLKPRARLNLGLAFYDRGEAEKAIVEIRRSIELFPDYQAAHARIGEMLLEIGRYDDAVKSLKKALSLEPDDWRSMRPLATALAKTGSYDEAVVVFRQYLRYAEEDIASANNFALLLSENGKADYAVEFCGYALSKDPDNPDVHYNLALIHIDAGDTDRAVEELRAVILLSPQDEDALNLLKTLAAHKQKD